MASLYGAPELAWFQVTPFGMQRLQNNQLRGLGSASKNLLKEMVSYGGTMEYDEIKIYGSIDSPAVLNVALKRLMDLGYVESVQSGEG